MNANVENYNGKGFTPLFYSEISSSYMLFDIFKSHQDIISELIYDCFKVLPEKIIIERERSYPKKGSIDIFIEFMSSNKKHALLIEVKVHDYLSATDGQISIYYNAVLDDGLYDEVYFIYLTQFTSKYDFNGVSIPKTIDEAKKGNELIKEKFVHISWKQMHEFLNKHYEMLTGEQQLIVFLNRQWILQQCEADLESNKIDIGERGLEDYFPDLKIDIRSRLPFGKEVDENRRKIWTIDTTALNENQLDTVLDTIKIFSGSNVINKIKQYKTEEITLQGAKDFLILMTQSVEDWRLLSFYSKLFHFVEKTSCLKFNGTGTRGFSIKLEIQGKGEISLCTIYKNKTIYFSLKR